MTPRFPILLEHRGTAPWGDEFFYTELYQTGTEIDRLRAQIGKPDSHITGVVMLPEDVIATARQIIAGVTQ